MRVCGLVLRRDDAIPGEFEIIRTPAHLTSRQREQSGLFTRLRDAKHLELAPYLLAKGRQAQLFSFDIPQKDGYEALRDLQLMNITPATLYPDPHGAAHQANLDYGRLRSDLAMLSHLAARAAGATNERPAP